MKNKDLKMLLSTLAFGIIVILMIGIISFVILTFVLWIF